MKFSYVKMCDNWVINIKLELKEKAEKTITAQKQWVKNYPKEVLVICSWARMKPVKTWTIYAQRKCGIESTQKTWTMVHTCLWDLKYTVKTWTYMHIENMGLKVPSENMNTIYMNKENNGCQGTIRSLVSYICPSTGYPPKSMHLGAPPTVRLREPCAKTTFYIVKIDLVIASQRALSRTVPLGGVA